MDKNMEAGVRLRRPERSQVVMRMECDDDLIPADHQARVIWSAMASFDFSAFYDSIKARAGVSGRDSTDPRLLAALWLYGATRGVGSARELARLCGESKPYRWLCGGVSVNHHLLGDFRVGHAAALSELFTQVLAVLSHKELIKVHRISQDGTRVRACCGGASLRSEERLKLLLEEAEKHVDEVMALLENPARCGGWSARQKAARRRAARERTQRLEAALAMMPQIKAQREATAQRSGRKKMDRSKARASTTDAEARLMKMGDGGFRPAMNVQLAVDTHSRAIVGVEVVADRSDQGLAEPMRQQVEQRTGKKVSEHLLDGGFLVLEEINRADAAGVQLLVPPPTPRNTPRDRARAGAQFEPRTTDTPAVAAWRKRMSSPEGQAIYQERGSTVETVNADLKQHRGLVQLTVRGLAKAKSVALWCALAYNLLHFGRHLIG
jgi:transposase